ncbi:MAG: TAT-variant-translocated molybdopterin oxidoreductase [Chitinophagales bacterium]|nr:TAT-variant-translocated molybdopterin oxidoreductase [Chitinophagaceae bacterium]MCB9065303.1 TAT-variant-translocated molybdopterin oxidoreductase [Chitinophagales bacterium]
MSQKQYWKGLEELNETEAHKEVAANEFREELPFDLSGKLLDANTPRRDFLKFLGFSTAAATLAASCEMPVRKAIPYAIKPEEIVPGVPNYYASTFVDGGDYCAVVVKTRDGRPIKIEGNEKSSITQGGTSARVQASVLNLYDNARLRQPHADGKEATFEAIDRQITDGLNAGGQAYLLTSTIISPTTKAVIADFLAKYPNAKHITYDPMSYSGMLLANEVSYGKRALPSYHFEKANTIVSLGADFLGTWLSPVEFAKQYSKGRKINAKHAVMSKHYHVEPTHTITGAKADERATCRPSEMGKVAVALYNAIANGAKPNLGSDKLNKVVANAAKDLKNGNGLVVCGSNDKDTQVVVNAINSAIGANGTTINWGVTSNYKQGIDSDMVALTDAMNGGKVSALMIHGVNPVYDYYNGQKFADGLGKVAVSVSFADRMDETAQKCKYVVPDHNYLESWGDAEPKSGYYSLMQPGIAPLFKTRAFQDSLLTWAGSSTSYGDMWKAYWMNKLGGQRNFDMALQDGVIEPSEMPVSGASFAGDVNGAISNIQAKKAVSGTEVVVYQKISLGYGGAWSNNPWLQEMPDPITKATWDNYLCVSPQRAKDMDEELTSITEVVNAKRVVKISVEGAEPIELPIVVVPGMHNDVVAVAVGYGRDAKVGMAARAGLDKWGKEIGGKNVYPLVGFNGNTFSYSAAATVEKTDKTYDVAITQTHNSYEGRPIIHEYTLDEFKKDPEHLMNERKKELEHYSHLPWEHKEGGHGAAAAAHGDGHAAAPMASHHDDNWEEGFRKNGTLYPVFDSPGIHWGMSIDLTSCIGCGACVVGCQAENNVSVVGKTHVLKSQEMHWIRIDRYFSGSPADPDTIQTVFQPMMCQHCDNAPCENVCPVSATNHSSEGLNQMAYNRCIGTKYCANNCPYKVRHFNWMDWNGADCFEDNLYEDYRRDEMNSDLTRMVLNPDVTVRSRGVMEKCSFCVQRLQEAKLQAKKEGHPMRDGAVRTACQQACPTDAIVFGNVNDKKSAIYNLRKSEQKERVNYVLEQIHTLPNVNYLSLIRNTDEIIAGDEDKDDMLNKIMF